METKHISIFSFKGIFYMLCKVSSTIVSGIPKTRIFYNSENKKSLYSLDSKKLPEPVTANKTKRINAKLKNKSFCEK